LCRESVAEVIAAAVQKVNRFGGKMDARMLGTAKFILSVPCAFLEENARLHHWGCPPQSEKKENHF
jgi:hypothetical protein